MYQHRRTVILKTSIIDKWIMTQKNMTWSLSVTFIILNNVYLCEQKPSTRTVLINSYNPMQLCGWKADRVHHSNIVKNLKDDSTALKVVQKLLINSQCRWERLLSSGDLSSPSSTVPHQIHKRVHYAQVSGATRGGYYKGYCFINTGPLHPPTTLCHIRRYDTHILCQKLSLCRENWVLHSSITRQK